MTALSRIFIGLLACTFASSLCWGADNPVAQHGLKVEIFEGRHFEKLHYTGVDSHLEHFWDWGSPHENVPVDNFSIRWSGWIRAPRDGRYKLIFTCNDGVRVRLGGALILDDWNESNATRTVSVELTEKPQPFTVDYYEAGTMSWMSMHWQPVGAAYDSVVPPEAFFPDELSMKSKSIPDRSWGLTADYFDRRSGRKLLSGQLERTEGMWQHGAALAVLPKDVVARYSGYLVPRYTGKHKLIGFAHGNMKVWIDNQPILSAGAQNSPTTLIDLEAHKPVAIQIEYTRGETANFYVHWVEPVGNKEISIPTELLYVNKAALPKKQP